MKHRRYLCCLSFIILLLAACNSDTGMSSSPDTIASSSTAVSATLAIGSFREYSLPQSNSGLMRPAIDHQGRLWFGEMGHNYLASFDPRTQTFQQMIPPHGRSGIMGVTVAPDNTIWFAEQYANYLGHYLPSTNRFQTYPLPTLTIPDPSNAGKMLSLPSAPNDVVLDAKGDVWFTELNADSIGRLDPHTGRIRQYPLSTKRSVQTLNPYGITIDIQGMVWFTESSNEHIGRLDPASGKISLFTMPGLAPNTTFMEIASDAQDMIWATSFSSSLLLSFNPTTSTFTPYYLPSSGNGTSGLYGLTVTTSREVWVTVAAQNVIARLDAAQNQFIYYHIPTNASFPFGIVIGTNNTLWFTEAGSDKIGMLKP
jgi:virginiamycin B lyase